MIDCPELLESEPWPERAGAEPGRWRNSPPGGGFLGEASEARAGEDAMWCSEGRELGVGGTSNARLNVNC